MVSTCSTPFSWAPKAACRHELCQFLDLGLGCGGLGLNQIWGSGDSAGLAVLGAPIDSVRQVV